MKLTFPLAFLLVVVLISVTGCEVQPVTGTNSQSSANMGKIVFVSSPKAEPFQELIYIVDSDGSNLKRLTDNEAGDSAPVLSPDGSKIVFGSYRDGNYEIYVMNADGSNQTRLTTNTALDVSPQWLPDGKRISFASDRSSAKRDLRIYIMNADGTNQIRLSKNSFYEGEHSWSPDGTRVAFTSKGDDGHDYIAVMNADGTDMQRLTSMLNEWVPAWSPDGKKIAFQGFSDELKNPDRKAAAIFDFNEIYVMNADGSNQINLTNNLVSDAWPAWSPDSQKIVFVGIRGCANLVGDIYVMNADGSNIARLIDTNCIGAGCPSWR